MIDEILSPPAMVALLGALTTAAVAWAVHKSRAEKLDATRRSYDWQVEQLQQEVVRLSSAPPPPNTFVMVVPERSSVLPATRREGGTWRAADPWNPPARDAAREATREPLDTLLDSVMSARSEELARRASLLPGEVAITRPISLVSEPTLASQRAYVPPPEATPLEPFRETLPTPVPSGDTIPPPPLSIRETLREVERDLPRSLKGTMIGLGPRSSK